MEGLEDGDLVALLGKVASAGQARRASADDGYLVAVGFRFYNLVLAVLHIPVSRKALQTADGNRLALDAAHALGFTLGLLRTYTAADCRQRTGLLDGSAGVGEFVLGDQLDKFRDLHVDWAAADAGHMFAVEAALCFLYRHLFGVSVRNFLKVSGSYFWVLLRHGELCHGHVRH